MEKQLVSGELGKIGGYEIALKTEFGQIKLAAEIALHASSLVDLVIDAAEKAIPGDFDKPLLEIVRAAAKSALGAPTVA